MSTHDDRSIEEIVESPRSNRRIRLVVSVSRDGDPNQIARKVKQLDGDVLKDELPFDMLVIRLSEEMVGSLQSEDDVSAISRDSRFEIAHSPGN